ncbi:MAG: NAD-dependent protein deacylase [Bacteroidetes bacterium]|nr:NAD-dependent protein deacylase [Bacteroidota bacterium]
MKQKIVILTGAGISAESGIQTFRGQDGLWEGHRIEDVASPEGWRRNRELVLDFYNKRRRQLLEVKPNAGHEALVELEKKYDVTIITQNVDDLHERAGSSDVVHLHGELFKVRSTLDESLVYEWKKDLNTGDKCDKGSQLRPHIVWFGEMVPMIERAQRIASKADIFMVIGTSLVVYPAAGLLHYAPAESRKFLIDPYADTFSPSVPNLRTIVAPATKGVPEVVSLLMAE